MKPIALYPARRNLIVGLGILAVFAPPSLSAALQWPVAIFGIGSGDVATTQLLKAVGWLALLFNYQLHRVAPVTRGERDSLTIWADDPALRQKVNVGQIRGMMDGEVEP